jgi:hypothetical protein
LTAIVLVVLLLASSHAALALAQEQTAAPPETPAAEAESAPQAEGEEPPPPKCEGVLKCIEATWLAKWIREDPSPFAFAGILLLHTVGMSLVVGINAGIDLRVLGLAREMPLAPLEKFFPVLWIGFYINAISGILLLYADASTKLINPDFWVKLVFITLAVITLKRLRRVVFTGPQIDSKPLPANAKLLAVASLFFWVGAVVAGRLMAYIPHLSNLEF